ncbi:hypothetical protein [Nocardioides cynanchi]|uniref:hypothetical protein n=1 Tax=Nocardioides cynanchi TaxID=2558918 RepID=UPI0012447718|nr:hypothetical protein [Nocardioides cynanchi]
MSRAGFAGTARVASGSLPTDALSSYDVRVADGRLRLSASGATGVVLDVPVDDVRVRPLGRAGTSVVEIAGAPILVDLTRRTSPGTRRLIPALRGRWLRRRFVTALHGGAR